mmetsp:Transcript_46339/g.76673  ORF Transcript_46339/g.76673 Transcript_46339/m.76673 type:complete len:233 (+) Transcript_46339:402-1100(+)
MIKVGKPSSSAATEPAFCSAGSVLGAASSAAGSSAGSSAASLESDNSSGDESDKSDESLSCFLARFFVTAVAVAVAATAAAALASGAVLRAGVPGIAATVSIPGCALMSFFSCSTSTSFLFEDLSMVPPKCAKAIAQISGLVMLLISPSFDCSLATAAGAELINSAVACDSFASFSSLFRREISASEFARSSWFFSCCIRFGSFARPECPRRLPKLSSFRLASDCFASAPWQ